MGNKEGKMEGEEGQFVASPQQSRGQPSLNPSSSKGSRSSLQQATTDPGGAAPTAIPEVAFDAAPVINYQSPNDRPLSVLPITSEDEAANNKPYKDTTKLTVDDFELLRVIGRGSFGKVMLVRKKGGSGTYAMKVLKKAQLVKRKQVAHTRTERRVLEDIDNPFIVALRYAFQTDEKLYMVLDYFPGGELFFHLKNGGRFSEERARFYAAEIAIALQCLHDNQIVYRDLKPENVLLDELGHIRLTDFGLSKENVSLTKFTQTFCGTPEYLAPEVVCGQPYGTPVDWWSLGTLLFEMLTGLPPFYDQNLQSMYEKIVKGKIAFPPYLSEAAKQVLLAFLERDSRKRLGCRGHGIEELKVHPFFHGIDWEALRQKQLTPPFKPSVVDASTDTKNIDEEFTKETPKDTPVVPSTLRSRVQFEDFTYDSSKGKKNALAGSPDDADAVYLGEADYGASRHRGLSAQFGRIGLDEQQQQQQRPAQPAKGLLGAKLAELGKVGQ